MSRRGYAFVRHRVFKTSQVVDMSTDMNLEELTGGAPDTWSWSHLKTFIGQDEAAEHFYAGGPYFAWNWNMILYVCLAVMMGYTVIGWFSNKTNWVDRTAKAERLSDLSVFFLSTHIIFAVLFTAQVFPYTYCAFHFYFTTYGIGDWTIAWSSSIMIFSICTRLVLYIIEVTVRGVIRPFIFITSHHGLFYVFVITGFVTRSVFALKVMVCIDVFASWEFLLFLTLVSRKLRVFTWVSKALLLSGILVYFLTRCLQFAILASLFAYGYKPMSYTARNRFIYWFFAVMIIGFHIIQTYTYVIYHNVWHSIKKAEARERQSKLPITTAAKDENTASEASMQV